MKFNFSIDIIQILKNKAYKCYKKVQNNVLIANIVNYIYICIIPYLKKSVRPCKYNPRKIKFEKNNYIELKDIRDVKIAVICDEMTYRCFSNECEVVFLTPYDWLKKINTFKPDFLLCESTWSGIKEYEDCWRGRIYKNNYLKFENRKVLLQILDYCKRAQIQTVFWNKEDPTFFNHKIYNFADTALYFDYIFTTAKECVEKYKSMGHNNVNVLMFGFSPKMYNPIGSNEKEDVCMFAGSWYSDQPQRCEDMNKLLNLVLKEEMNFKIYDRYYHSGNPVNLFPKRYRQFLNEGINFTELSSVIKKARYAVNINTVTSSETMFARRVFETAACNTCIISNYSVGMNKLFGNNIWFLNKKFDKSLIDKKSKRNVDIVFKNHTYKQRLKEVLDILKIKYVDSKNQIKIIYASNDVNKCKTHFKEINFQNKEGFILNEYELVGLYDGKKINLDSFYRDSVSSGYFTILNLDTLIDFDLGLAVEHFSYIDDSVGIRKGKLKYEFVTDKININTVFSTKLLSLVLINIDVEINKYII